MERKLGGMEIAPAISNQYASFNLVSMVRMKNAPQVQVIRKALDILQTRHPALRVRIELRGCEYYFRSDSVPEIGLSTVAREADKTWEKVVDRYLNEPFDWQSGPLLGCAYVLNDDRNQVSELVLAAHHVIIDATSALALMDELLNLCAQLMAGEVVELKESYPMLPAIEMLFPPAYRGLRLNLRTAAFMLKMITEEFVFRFKTRNSRKPPLVVKPPVRTFTKVLDAEMLQALERRARREKVTFASVQHAAIMMAAWKHLYAQEPLPLKHFVFQNMRPFLTEVVPDDHLGCYISMLQLTFDLSTEKSIWQLAKEINTSIYKEGKGAGKYISTVMAGTMMKMLFKAQSFRIGQTSLNYSGVIPLQKKYGKIEISEVYGFVSNFGLGPEFAAQTAIWDGDLYWNFLYLESDMDREQAQAVANDVFQNLSDALEEQ